MRAIIMLGLALVFEGATVGAFHPGLAAQTCQPLDAPKRTPSLNQLLDSAALVADITAGQVIDTAGIALGLAYPERAGPPAVNAVEPGDSAKASGDFRRRVQALLRVGGAVPGTSLRLHVRSPADIRVERSILCPPVSYDSVALMRVAVASGRGGAVPLQRWPSLIRVLVGVDGRVLDARLQPGSGRADLDRIVLEPVFVTRWRPATLDGRPVKVWLANGRAKLAR